MRAGASGSWLNVMSATSEKQLVKVGRRTLAVSNLEKVLYPESGFT